MGRQLYILYVIFFLPDISHHLLCVLWALLRLDRLALYSVSGPYWVHLLKFPVFRLTFDPRRPQSPPGPEDAAVMQLTTTDILETGSSFTKPR